MAISPTTLNRTKTGEISGVRRSPAANGSRAVAAGSEPDAPVVEKPVVADPTEHNLEQTNSAHLRRPGIENEPLSAWSDVELLCGFREGNERAYAELYARHKGEIYTYCVRMMSNDADLASDAFQEIFIKVYEKADQFRDGTNVMGWLYMIARNTCLNVFRTKRPNDALDQHLDLESRDRSLAPEYDEEQHFLRAKLEQSIARLPVEFREPFIMREFDGFSYSEIAELTGTTLAVTKVRIHRAKQKMRELLKPYLND